MTTNRDSGGTRRLSIVLHAQHLSGVGHYVRTFEIARELSAFHDVWLIEGGRKVPRAAEGRIQRLHLPAIARGPAGLVTLDDRHSIGAAMRERVDALCERIRSVRPDVLLVEHFPLSKWDLEGEILGAIEETRRANPAAKILCSLRDIAPQTRHEAVPAATYRKRVLDRLSDHFDAVLVHGDPRLATVEEFLPDLPQSGVPVHYTGMVSEKFAGGTDRVPPGVSAQQPFVLLSAGGGTGDARFIDVCLDAWTKLRREGTAGDRQLLVFAGLGWSADRVTELGRRAAGQRVGVRSFTANFLLWLRAADLAVTHAGYNTCANILETRARALLVPDPWMSDQAMRAAKLAQAGVVESLAPESLSADALAEAMLRAFARPAPRHDFDLEGALKTRLLLESIARTQA